MAKSERTSASKNTHHVVPSPVGGWSVKKGGAERASRHFPTKKEAVKQGRAVSRRQNTDLYVHNKDGTVERKESHRRDLNPPEHRDTDE